MLVGRLCRATLAIFFGFFGTLGIYSAQAQYVVGGMTLGSQISVETAEYKSYACVPSVDFFDVTSCVRTQTQRNSEGRNVSVTTQILHKPDGTTLYLMVDVKPATLNRRAVDREIEELSRKFKAQPKMLDLPQSAPSGPTAIIATWGGLELEEVHFSDVAELKAGKNLRLGALEDLYGDLKKSIREENLLFRYVRGRGYLYSASFERNGVGHRRYVAIDAEQLTLRNFEMLVQTALEDDKPRASDDYGLWPNVARPTRRLARDISIKTANESLDRVFARFPSKKLWSHGWSILPGGAIEHLTLGVYSTDDTYGPNTKHPEIRQNILSLLSANPSAPFAEFLLYALGEFQKGLELGNKSAIKEVLHYAIAHKSLELLLLEAYSLFVPKDVRDGDAQSDITIGVDHILRLLNQNPEYYDSEPLEKKLPSFSSRVGIAKPHFEVVLQNTSAPHADDAAYMLGWIAAHERKPKEALAYFSQALKVGNGDFKRPAAMKQTVRLLELLASSEQISLVETDQAFAQQAPLWYQATRSAYRDFNHAVAASKAETALRLLRVPLESLPVTTDPERIGTVLRRTQSEDLADINIHELVYLLYASREIQQYKNYLRRVATERPSDFSTRAKAIILKYSLFLNPPEERRRPQSLPRLRHRDLRQAVHLIDVTIESTPKTPAYNRLLEWLYYRKVVILADFDAEEIAAAVASMEKDLPASLLLDDVLAEQIAAEGFALCDLESAQATFAKLLAKYPRGNAVDNAHNWMAIILRNEGRLAEAQNIDRDIIRRFPTTRHAQYARERLAADRRQPSSTPSSPLECGDN